MPVLDLIGGNQLFATTGRQPRIRLSDAVRAAVPRLAQDQAVAQEQERLRLGEAALSRESRQQTIGNIISGAGTLTTGGVLAKSLFAKPATAAVATPAAASGAGAATGAATTVGEIGSGVAGTAPTATSLLGPTGAALGTAAAGGFVGGTVVGALPVSRPVKGVLGAGAGAAGSVALGAAAGAPGGPIGVAVGALVGGLTAAKVCIIVTACAEHPEEIDLARRFRDRFMTREQLRAYYTIAEPMVARMEADEAYRHAIRESLVQPLLRYGAYMLGESQQRPPWRDESLGHGFLALLEAWGHHMAPFTRQNGEVV